MYFFKTIIAEKKLEVECRYKDVFFQCKDYLADFSEPDYIIQVTESDIDQESNGVEIPKLGVGYERVSIGPSFGQLESVAIYHKIANKLVQDDVFLMHGSVIALDNEAYMFTAATGVGKTTRTRLWLERYPSSSVVNGDKPLIKITDTRVLVYGTPWCGKEGWNMNTVVPLRAIFLLERAELGEENSVLEVSLGKAFPFLLQQTYLPRDSDLMRRTLQLLEMLDGKVKIYKFRSTPTEKSVCLAYETAKPR